MVATAHTAFVVRFDAHPMRVTYVERGQFSFSFGGERHWYQSHGGVLIVVQPHGQGVERTRVYTVNC